MWVVNVISPLLSESSPVSLAAYYPPIGDTNQSNAAELQSVGAVRRDGGVLVVSCWGVVGVTVLGVSLLWVIYCYLGALSLLSLSRSLSLSTLLLVVVG